MKARAAVALAVIFLAAAALGQWDEEWTWGSGAGGGRSETVGTTAGIGAITPSTTVDGGCDQLIVNVTGNYGVPVQIAVEWRVAKGVGAHPTTAASWTSVVDTTGQSASGTHSYSETVDKYTARDDTLGVRVHVYVDGSLIETDVTTSQSTADYWLWWNYKFPFVISVDDGVDAAIEDLDALMTSMGGGRQFTIGVNLVHTLTTGSRATPTELRAYYDNGTLEIANHGYTAGSMYSLTCRGSFNTGGLISATDTVRAYTAGYWPGEFKAAWNGNYDTGNMPAYYADATDVMLSGFGILHDTSDSSLVWSPWTVETHLLAEIERDSMPAFGVLPSAADCKTFLYSQGTYNSDLLMWVEDEGYAGGRGAYFTTDCNDLGTQRNTWDAISIYRVCAKFNIFSWLDHLETESAFKTAIGTDIANSGVETDGGMCILTAFHYTASGQGTPYLTATETQWAIEEAESRDGIVKPFGEVCEYYRERAPYHYLMPDGDRVFATGVMLPDTLRACASSDVTADRSDQTGDDNVHWLPGGWDLTITDVAYSLISPAVGDSVDHVTCQWGEAHSNIYSATQYGSTPELYYPDDYLLYFDLSTIPTDATITQCTVHFRPHYEATCELDLAAGDTMYAAWSHATGDDWYETIGTPEGAFEAHASWTYQDGSSDVWSPTMAQREYQTSWRTIHKLPGPVSNEAAIWSTYDITDGCKAVVEDGCYNGGIHFYIIHDSGNSRELFYWESLDGSTVKQIMWVEIRYTVPLVTY